MSNNSAVNNNVVLTNLYRGYEPKSAQFIRPQILPVIPVNNSKGDIRKLKTTATDLLRIHTTVSFDQAKTPTIRFEVIKSSGWSCEKNTLQVQVTQEDGLRWAEPGQTWEAGMAVAEMVYTRFLKKTFMIAQEYALATTLTTSGNFTNKVTLSGSDQFSDRVNSDPIGVMKTAKDAIFGAIGVEANTVIMSRAVFEALRIHPQIKKTVGAVSGTGTVPVLSLTKEQVAMALGVDRVLVGTVAYDASKKGQTSSLTQVWGKYMLIAYINPEPSPNEFEQSLGYTFQLTPSVVDTYGVDDPKYAKFVRVEDFYDDVLLDETAAYLVSAAIA